MAGSVTNDKIYELVNSARLELKSDIGDLRRQFETLEAGRLTRLEAQMNQFEISQVKKDSTMQQNQAVLSNKVLILWGIANIILIGLTEALLKKYVK